MKKIQTKDFTVNKMLRTYEQRAKQNKARAKQNKNELEYHTGLHKITV